MEIESEGVWCFRTNWLSILFQIGVKYQKTLNSHSISRPKHIPLDNPKDKHIEDLLEVSLKRYRICVRFRIGNDVLLIMTLDCGYMMRYASCRRTLSSKDGNSANQWLFERQMCTVFASVTQAAFEGLILRYPMNIDHLSLLFRFSGTFKHLCATSCYHDFPEFHNFIYRCLWFILFSFSPRRSQCKLLNAFGLPSFSQARKKGKRLSWLSLSNFIEILKHSRPFHLPSPMLRMS